jgi:hypothetical protein
MSSLRSDVVPATAPSLRLDVEDDRVDEPAGLVESPLGQTGLPRGGHDPDHEARGQQNGKLATAVRCRRTNLPAR